MYSTCYELGLGFTGKRQTLRMREKPRVLAAMLFLFVFAVFFFFYPRLSVAPVFAKVTISISEVTRMDWGTLAIPASGSQYVEISASNSATSGTGGVLFGIPSRGVYRLVSSGGGSTAITIDIGNVTSGNANITISDFKGIYSATSINGFPSATLPLPGASGTYLYLGARATVGSATSPGSTNPTFDINVIVQ